MDRLEIRIAIQIAGEELYESIPTGPLKWLVGDIMANNEEYVLNNIGNVGADDILNNGFTVNQLEWINELKNLLEMLDKAMRFPTVHTMEPVDSDTNERSCFGKFSKDDVYCKECEVAVECYEKTENITKVA